MKIQPNASSYMEPHAAPHSNQTHRNETAEFKHLMKKAGTHQSEAPVQAMLEHLEKLKNALSEELTLTRLYAYKEAVGAFLRYYSEHVLKTQHVFAKDRRGIRKKYTTIALISEKTGALNPEMLSVHRDHLHLLNEIGEIHGLILNLVS